MTIAVDFDRVIHAYSRGWADGTIYDPPLPGAIEGLRTLLDQDAVFIHTSREPEQVMPWLGQHGFDVTTDDRCGTCLGAGGGQEVDLDDRPTHPAWTCDDCGGSGTLLFWNLRGQLLVTNRKLPAKAYLDDLAVRFENWDQALAALTPDGTAPRLLDCGWCYEEHGEEVHPHPLCPISSTNLCVPVTDLLVVTEYAAAIAAPLPYTPGEPPPYKIDLVGYTPGDTDRKHARRLILHPSLAAQLATDLAPAVPRELLDSVTKAVRGEMLSGKGPFAEVPRIAEAVLATPELRLVLAQADRLEPALIEQDRLAATLREALNVTEQAPPADPGHRDLGEWENGWDEAMNALRAVLAPQPDADNPKDQRP